MNTVDKVIAWTAGEEQRLGDNANKEYFDIVKKLCREYRMMEDRLPIITENDGAYE